MIIYHISLLIRKNKLPKEDEYPLIPNQPQADEIEVIHSVIELPKPDDHSPPPKVNIGEIEVCVLSASSDYQYTT